MTAVTTVLLSFSLGLSALLVLRGPELLGAMAEPGGTGLVADSPLQLPPTVPDPGGYTFISTTPAGDPVRWDPCRPVHVVVNPVGEPATGRQAVAAALAEVGGASGLVFVVDGETDEPPSTTRAATDRARYGDRWSPVLVSWSDASAYAPLAGAVGVAGPLPVKGEEGERYVSGSVTLDAAWFGDSLGHDVGSRQAAAVLRHELGHLVGLGHSPDPFSLMAPAYQSVFDFSLADRAGLARLGDGPCTGVLPEAR